MLRLLHPQSASVPPEEEWPASSRRYRRQPCTGRLGESTSFLGSSRGFKTCVFAYRVPRPKPRVGQKNSVVPRMQDGSRMSRSRSIRFATPRCEEPLRAANGAHTLTGAPLCQMESPPPGEGTESTLRTRTADEDVPARNGHPFGETPGKPDDQALQLAGTPWSQTQNRDGVKRKDRPGSIPCLAARTQGGSPGRWKNGERPIVSVRWRWRDTSCPPPSRPEGRTR